jgi:ribose transport system substrate-binding protein
MSERFLSRFRIRFARNRSGARSPLLPAVLVIACAALLVGVAGCGDSDDDSAGGGTNASADGGGESSFLSADASGRIDGEVEQLKQRPPSIGITEPINKPIPEGKVIDVIHCSVTACTSQLPFFEEAAEALGWEVNRINAGLTPETIKNAWEQAVGNENDAVITFGTPVAAYAPQLAELKALGIPVVNEFSSGDPAGNNGIIDPPIAGNDYFNVIGENLAKYVLSESTEPPNVAMFHTPLYPNNALIGDGFETVMKKECAECEFEKIEVPATSIGTNQLPQTIVSHLRGNPDVDWTLPAWNDLVVGLPAAMRGAGIEGQVKIVTMQAGGSPTTNAYLENEEGLVALGPVPGPDSQWRCFDELARYFTGQPTEPSGNENLPAWIVTREAMESEGLADEFGGNYPMVKDFKQQFEDLWGV